MFFFFKPTFPATKKTFVKSTLGFVAVILRKHLREFKPEGGYYLEGEYIVEAQRIVNDEFQHLIDRLKEVGMFNKEVDDAKVG